MNKLQLKGEMKIANRQIGEYYLTLQILKQGCQLLGLISVSVDFKNFRVFLLDLRIYNLYYSNKRR